MTSSPPPICFLDTETTGIHPGRLAWEIAMIRRDPDGTETTRVLHVLDIDLSAADPFGLNVGRFYERYLPAVAGWDLSSIPEPTAPDDPELATTWKAAQIVELMTRGAHIVGAVPNFDTETLDRLLRGHELIPAWHYHLIDVEALAVGYLRGKSAGLHEGAGFPDDVRPDLPWKSEDLSRACGVEPASDAERHTALGDARWAMRLYDAVMTPPGERGSHA